MQLIKYVRKLCEFFFLTIYVMVYQTRLPLVLVIFVKNGALIEERSKYLNNCK